MTINTSKNGNELLVEVSGRLDSTTAGDLEETLNTEMTDSIESLTVDLTNVDFISSKGLRVLVGAYKKLANHDITLKGANESIQEVIRLSGLLKIFKMV